MRPTRFYSNHQEKVVAKDIGGKQQSNSGATTFQKGDVVTDKFLIECKTCVEPKKSFSIKKEWIKKNRQEAFAMGKQYSALVFDFGDGEQHYVIDSKLFKQLQALLESEES